MNDLCKRPLAVLLLLALLMSLLPMPDAAAVSNAASGGLTYTTYAWDDFEEIYTIPYGSSQSGVKCNVVQGFNVGTNWLYTVNTNSVSDPDRIANVVRVHADTGEKQVMRFYDSLSATTPSDFHLGHCNDSEIVWNSKNRCDYFFATVMIAGYTIERLKIGGADSQGMYLTGYFDLKTTGGSSISANAISYFGETADDLIFLVGGNGHVYSCVISKEASGGPKSNPTSITCYRLFDTDFRSATIVGTGMIGGNNLNFETMVSQGFEYQPQEKLLYLPMSDFGDRKTATSNGSKEYIFTFNLKDLTVEQLMSLTEDQDKVRYCTELSFALTNPSGAFLEIENLGFRTTDADKRMYILANMGDGQNAHILRSKTYTRSTNPTDLTPINTGRHTYTVAYDSNGGANRTGLWYLALSSTRHISGITTDLRTMADTKPGYCFAGWNLSRNVDNKLLFWNKSNHNDRQWMTLDGVDLSVWELACYTNEQAVTILDAGGVENAENLVITCSAVWQKDSSARWTVIPDGVYRIGSNTNASLCVTAGSTANGTALYYKPLSEANAERQKFVFQSYGNTNQYTIRLAGTNLFLTADGGQCRNPANAADDVYRQQKYDATPNNSEQLNKNVRLTECIESNAQFYSSLSDKQKWYIMQDGSGLRLENVYTGLYLYVCGGTDFDGARVGQWHLNNYYVANRLVNLLPQNDFLPGTYEFFTRNNAFYRWSGTEHSLCVQPRNDSDSQQFRVCHLGDGWYSIQNIRTGKYVTALHGSDVVQTDWTGAEEQQWRIFRNYPNKECTYSIVNRATNAYANLQNGGTPVSGQNLNLLYGWSHYCISWYTERTYESELVTYGYEDVQEFASVPLAAGGGVQGMHIYGSTAYLFEPNDSNGTLDIMWIDMNTPTNYGKANFYSSLTAATPTNANLLGHANSVTSVWCNDSDYLFAVTLEKDHSIARIKRNGHELRLSGYFKAVTTDGRVLNPGSIFYFGTANGRLVFGLVDSHEVYAFCISPTDNGGTADQPRQITCCKVFAYDFRNTVFADGSRDALEATLAQGIGYHDTEKVLYVPMDDDHPGHVKTAYIFPIDLRDEDWRTYPGLSADCDKVYDSSNVSLSITKSTASYFEPEDLSFRLSDTDRALYFVTNEGDGKAHIYRTTEYQRSLRTNSLTSVSEGRHTYTVRYAPNGGVQDKSIKWHYWMHDTRHVNGIATALRANTFVKANATFLGWHLSRTGNQWLYWKKDNHGNLWWAEQGTLDSSYELARYEDCRTVSQLDGGAMEVENLVITCHAQWQTTEGTPATNDSSRYITIPDGEYRIGSVYNPTLSVTAVGDQLYFKPSGDQTFVLQSYGSSSYTVRLKGTARYLSADGGQFRDESRPGSDSARQAKVNASGNASAINGNVHWKTLSVNDYNNYNSGYSTSLSDKERWYILRNTDGSYRLENVYTGLYLYVMGGTDKDGAKVGQWYCTNLNNNPGYTLHSVNGFADGVYEIMTRNANCFRWSVTDGNAVVNAPDGSPAQQWRFTHTGDGYYTIENIASHLLLTSDGDNLYAAARQNDDTQLFRVFSNAPVKEQTISVVPKLSCNGYADLQGGGDPKANQNIEVYYNWSNYSIAWNCQEAVHRWNAGDITDAGSCTTDGTVIFTCIDCGQTRTEPVPAPGHQYENGICSGCGQADPVIAAACEMLRVHTISVSLRSDLSMNIYVKDNNLEGIENPYLLVTKESYDKDGNRNDGEAVPIKVFAEKSGCHVFSFTGIAAREMGCKITMQVCGTVNGVDCKGKVETYSIKQYAMRQLNSDTTDISLKTLLVNMLQYGSKAQQEFGYTWMGLADSELDNEHLWLVAKQQVDLTAKGWRSGSQDGKAVQIASVSVSLKERVTLNPYLDLAEYLKNGKRSDLELVYTINGEDHVIPGNQLYPASEGSNPTTFYYNITELSAAQMRTPVYFYVRRASDHEQLSITMRYSIAVYASLVYRNKDTYDPNLVALVEQMMKYSDSAKDYLIG